MLFFNAINTQECPIGTFKDVEGSNASLCTPCSLELLPSRASFIYVRGMSSLEAFLVCASMLCIYFVLPWDVILFITSHVKRNCCRWRYSAILSL